jgi:hypothetical protein
LFANQHAGHHIIVSGSTAAEKLAKLLQAQAWTRTRLEKRSWSYPRE